jgi:hypothetical protein
MKGRDRTGRSPETATRLAGRFAGDPLSAMRALKRWVRIVAYGAVCAEWPLYYLLLGYPLRNIASSWAFGMVVATVAIEFAFAQGYRLRKQGIYPAMLAVEVGASRDFRQACEAAVRLVAELLRTDQVVLAFSGCAPGNALAMVPAPREASDEGAQDRRDPGQRGPGLAIQFRRQ